MVSHGSLKTTDPKNSLHLNTIHRLPHQIDRGKFSQILEERKLLVSLNGRHLSRIRISERESSCLEIVHQDRHRPTPIAQGVLLWVTSKQTLIWGQGVDHQPSGIYSVSDQGISLLQRLDRLNRIIRTPSGPMLHGTNVNDEHLVDRYLLPHGRGFVLARGNMSISLHRNGQVSLIEECQGRLRHNLWSRDGSFEEIRSFTSHEQVRVLPWQEGFAYVIDHGDDFVFETEGIDMFDFETYRELPGQIEFFWVSPSQKHIFMLVTRPERGRQGCAYRQLYSDGELVPSADGYFQMGPEDLRWSRDDSQYVVRIRRHFPNAKGQICSKNRLITSMDQVFDAPAQFDLHDMVVDNHGEIMFYVLSDGELHYPFFYGEPLEPATYIWNLHNFKKAFSGNRLVGDTIEQFRLNRRS